MDRAWWIYVRRIVKQYLISLCIVGIVLFIYGRPNMIFGIFVGELIGSVCIFIMGNRILKSADIEPEAAVLNMKIGWMIRLFFILGCLIAVIQISVALFWAVVTGFFLSEFIMLANAMHWMLRKKTAKQK